MSSFVVSTAPLPPNSAISFTCWNITAKPMLAYVCVFARADSSVFFFFSLILPLSPDVESDGNAKKSSSSRQHNAKHRTHRTNTSFSKTTHSDVEASPHPTVPYFFFIVYGRWTIWRHPVVTMSSQNFLSYPSRISLPSSSSPRFSTRPISFIYRT